MIFDFTLMMLCAAAFMAGASDDTAFVQAHRPLGEGWATQTVQSMQEEKQKGERYCRIIGPGSGVLPAANAAAQEKLLAHRCTQIDWDGDPLAPGNFAGALIGINLNLKAIRNIKMTPHCTLSDCGANDGYGVSQEQAIEVRKNGGKYTAAGVVPVGAKRPDQADDLEAEKPLWDAAAAKTASVLPNALEAENPDNNFKKYTTLAIADVQLTEYHHNFVIWLVDTHRPKAGPLKPGKTFGDGYWNWVSLAEYLVYPVSPKRNYVYLDSRTGADISQAEIDAMDWNNMEMKVKMGVNPA